MNNLRNIVSRNVYYYRTRATLTQQALADLVDMDKGAISEIERGVTSPKLETLDKIAKALKINATLLFSEPRNES